MWIYYVLVISIVLFKVRLAGKGKWHEDFMSLEVSKGILGISAVLVVLHHISQKLGTLSGSLLWLSEVGVCPVGLFFFFSGYGLFKSLKEKDNYLKNYISKRYSKILIPFYFCIFLFFMFGMMNGVKYNWISALKTLTGYRLVNPHMWYIVEVAVLYFAFFLLGLTHRDWIVLGGMLLFCIALIVFSITRGHCLYGERWFYGEWWYNTTILFWVGMMFYKFEKKIVSIFKRIYYPLVVFLLTGTYFFYRLQNEMLAKYSYWSETGTTLKTLHINDKLRCFFSQEGMVIFFVFAILVIGMKIQCRNKILSFLGEISLELYLIHNMVLRNCTPQNPQWFVGTVVLLSILLATGIHYILNYRRISNKKIV